MAGILALYRDSDDVLNFLQSCIRHASSALPSVDQRIRSAAQARYLEVEEK